MATESEDSGFFAEDRDLLEQVANWPEYRNLQDLTAENLQEISTEHGIDFATALLYQRLLASEEHGPAIEALKQPCHHSPVEALAASAPEVTFAVAPGAFYLEYPETGADGKKIREAAQSLGCHAALIPTASIGTLEENAEAIISWLLRNRGKKIILASLSKGSADIKVALQHRQATEAFAEVVAWINVGGIVDGSPMVTWALSRKIPKIIARTLFWWRRRNFQFFSDLDRRAGKPLDFPIRFPKPIMMIHVVGFPLRHHLSTKHSRMWHRRLLEYGPNDAATVLIDNCKLPGIVFPIWGADHYAADRVDWAGLTRNLLAYLGTSPRTYA